MATAATLVSDPASVVNPFIGTTNSGDDFPGADVPFGMVQWSPDTTSRPDGGGYEYNDTSILGFSLTHIAGPGCGAAGDVPILPTVGRVKTSATDSFSHSNESANAGYYSVLLGNDVKTELTATPRTGMGRFTFPSTKQANLIFKLSDSQNGDSATSWNVVSSSEVSGSVTSGHFCGASNTYTVYFDMMFDHAFSGKGTIGTAALMNTTSSSTASPSTPETPNHPVLHGSVPTTSSSTSPAANSTNPANAYVTFDTSANQVVQAKVGISYVSISNAKANLLAENSGWDFTSVQQAAHTSWNNVLSRIGIAGGTSTQQQVFYTALYHSLLHPNIFSDTNGQYTGFDGAVHTVDSGHSAVYANYSGWDVYRSQAQLSALVAPSVASDIAQSMVDSYAQTKMLPKWSEDNGETYVMVGDPADPIIADYYAFGARNFDTTQALNDMIAEASTTNNIRPGEHYLDSPEYLPSDGSYGCCNFYGPVSTQLEYNSADAAIGWLAGQLGNTSAQTKFINRAQGWRNVFNTSNGFMQPRQTDGSWISNFDPTSGTDFVEGTSWQYTGMVPFNIHGLAMADGGNANYNTNYLDKVLSGFLGANGNTADLRNEPSLELPWEYDYTGEPYKTQSIIRQIQDQIWVDAPNGIAGNDDLGEMSSWYVWSALGMYPETPGTSDLALGSPLFTQAVVTLPSGATLTINGTGAADNAAYVQSATWNGSAWNNAYAPSAAITTGGTLTYTLGTAANTSWASAASAAPPSYPGSVTYNNIGISDDSNPSAANFDAGGFSYSTQALANAGVTPGSTITANGVNFVWPNVAAGNLDNYMADGQTINVSGSGSIAFLGAASNGPSSGTVVINYSDGTSQSVTLGFSDWTLNAGGASPLAGTSIAVTTPYRNSSGGSPQQINTYVFATSPIALASGKTVVSVTLPSVLNQGLLHVFAIGFA